MDIDRGQLEALLCKKLQIPSIRSGHYVLRDEKRWRVNEIEIEYSWLIQVKRAFNNQCWLFSIKFNESQFRDIHNPEELIQGIFTINDNKQIDLYYATSFPSNTIDKVHALNTLDLYNANKGIVLDGVVYEYLIYARNSEIQFKMNNPSSGIWKGWEAAVWELGKELSEASAIDYFKNIFN